MDVKLKKESKEMLTLELVGGSHTIPNLLRSELWNDSTVTFAAYEKKHPYLGNPLIIVRAKDSMKSLKGAISRSQDNISEFEKLFVKACGK
ncbi:MAG: RpoL/Rpb11 RNA polymerase subunit family protein [archaeon]